MRASFGKYTLHVDGDGELGISYPGKPLDEAILQVIEGPIPGTITVRMHNTKEKGNQLEGTKQFRMYPSAHNGIDRWEAT